MNGYALRNKFGIVVASVALVLLGCSMPSSGKHEGSGGDDPNKSGAGSDKDGNKDKGSIDGKPKTGMARAKFVMKGVQ